MTVSILDAMQHSPDAEAGALLVSSGSSRLAWLITAGAGGASASGRTGVTAGGIAMTKVVEVAGNDRGYLQLWVLIESEIAQMVGNSLSYSGGDAPGGRSTIQWTVQNAPQSAWTVAEEFDEAISVSASLIRASDSITFAVGFCSNKWNGGVTLTNPSQSASYIANSYYALGYGSQSDLSGTSSVTANGAGVGAIHRRMVIAVNITSATTSSSIGTDNEIDQFERDVDLDHPLVNPLTKCLINGVDHVSLLQAGDTQLKYIKRVFDVAGQDTCSVVLGDEVAADVTLSGVTVNTDKPFDVPYKKVDGNSISKGVQELAGPNAALKITTAPSHGTLDTDAAGWLEVDINDVFTAEAGYIGTDTIVFEIHDPDEASPANRTQTLTITLDIQEGGGVVVVERHVSLNRKINRGLQRKLQRRLQ